MIDTIQGSKNLYIQQMTKKSNDELLEILKCNEDYQNEKFEAALHVVTERNLADARTDNSLQEYEEKQWYYQNYIKKHGPFSKSKIKDLIETKEIDIYTKVWRKGFKKWAYIDETELKELLVSETPPQFSAGNMFLFLLVRMLKIVFISVIALTIFYVGGWEIILGKEVTFLDSLLGDGGLKLRTNLIAFGLDGKYYGLLNAKRFFDVSFISLFMLFISLGVFYYALKHLFLVVKDD